MRVLHYHKGVGKIFEFSCDLDVEDCLDASDWDGADAGTDPDAVEQFSGLSTANNGVRWLQVREATNGRRFVIWQETVSFDDEVRYATMCPGDTSWSTPISIQDPDSSMRYSSLLSGQPKISVDNEQSLVHVSWVNVNNRSSPTDGDVWWGRTSFSSCP